MEGLREWEMTERRIACFCWQKYCACHIVFYTGCWCYFSRLLLFFLQCTIAQLGRYLFSALFCAIMCAVLSKMHIRKLLLKHVLLAVRFGRGRHSEIENRMRGRESVEIIWGQDDGGGEMRNSTGWYLIWIWNIPIHTDSAGPLVYEILDYFIPTSWDFPSMDSYRKMNIQREAMIGNIRFLIYSPRFLPFWQVQFESQTNGKIL